MKQQWFTSCFWTCFMSLNVFDKDPTEFSTEKATLHTMQTMRQCAQTNAVNNLQE